MLIYIIFQYLYFRIHLQDKLDKAKVKESKVNIENVKIPKENIFIRNNDNNVIVK